MAKYAQPILFFYCRPCADYHPKTHPHYAEMLERKAQRAEAKAAQPQKQRKKKAENR